MPEWAWAGIWGLVAGSALIIGAAGGYYASLSQRWIASIMAFGGGVLIAALAFEFMDEAYRRDGIVPTAIGFLVGAVVYSGVNVYLSRRGARHRKRSGDQQPRVHQGGGLTIAIGSLLDSVPEAIAIGVSMVVGGAVSLVAIVAIFLSNIPEGLSSSAGMKRAGRSPVYIFGVWGAITLVVGASSLTGYAIFGDFPNSILAGTTALAAGAILAMLADTMIPEAVEHAHDLTGMITVFGFLAAYVLSKSA